MKRIALLSVLLAGFGAYVPAANAADFDYNKALDYNTDVDRYRITVDRESSVWFFTSSWDSGGFDPYLTLWDGGGNLITGQDDNGRTGSKHSNGGTYTYGDWDGRFNAVLDEGVYTLTITTRESRAGAHPDRFDKLSDGFVFDKGNPIPFALWEQPSNGYRAGDYELHIVNLNGSVRQVPEPSTLFMLGSVMAAGLAAASRKILGKF